MSRFGKLTRFEDSLDMEDLGEWITEYDSSGRLVGTPYVEYWDVVHRFITALDDAPLGRIRQRMQLKGPSSAESARGAFVFRGGS